MHSLLLEKIDIYGLQIPLRYHKKRNYNTICGAIFSLITFIISFIIILIHSINVYNHKNFTIISNSIQLYEKKILNFSRVPLLIGFINDGGRPIKLDPKYISITLDKNDHYSETNEDGIKFLRRESKSIELEYCDLNKHFNNDIEVIEMINDFEYQNYLCVVPGQNLSIAGRFGDSIHGYDMLEIHLIKCENTSDNFNCASEEELEKFYTNSYMSILYLSETLNHYDFNNPIRKTFRSEVFLVVSNSVKRYYYYFAPGEYISHNGFFFSINEKFEFFEYQNFIVDFVDKEDQSFYSENTKIEVSFSCNDIFVSYERKYDKIEDYFGSISAWIRFVYIFCKIISHFFSKKIFLFEIINKIFSVEQCDKNKKNITQIIQNKSLSKRIKLNTLVEKSERSQNKSFSKLNKGLFNYYKGNIILNNKNINKSKIKTPETLRVNSYIFKLKIYEYFLPFFFLRKIQKFQYLEFFETFIYTDISIEVIIPLIERMSKINSNEKIIKKKDQNYLTKMNSTILKTNIVNVNV